MLTSLLSRRRYFDFALNSARKARANLKSRKDPEPSSSKLCEFCKSIFIALKYPDHYCPLQRCILEIYNSAEDGCELCILFSISLRENAAAAKQRQGPVNADHWDISNIETLVYYRFAFGESGFQSDVQKHGVEGIRLDRDYEQRWAIPLAWVALAAEAGSEAAVEGRVVRRMLPKDPSSASRFTTACLWLTDCIIEHPNCLLWSSHCLRPTRLIEIELLVRLVENVDTPYVTLSHCWGGNQFIRLTSQNIEHFRERISFEILPKAFRDAITVTQRLGISNIWIDSLCIIQDLEDDWASECVKMGDIYRGSVCTITASEASDSSQGCLVTLKHEEPSCTIPYYGSSGSPSLMTTSLGFQRLLETNSRTSTAPVRDKNGKDAKRDGLHSSGRELLQSTGESVSELSSSLLGIPGLHVASHESPREQGAVFSRGWILQEHLLSTRILFFTSSGMHWQCQECERSEIIDAVLLPAVPFTYQTFRKYMACAAAERLDGATCTNVDHTQISKHYQWASLVEIYAKRSLSFSTDRLPALSALAREFASILDDTYVAGLWRKTLIQDLAWTLENPKRDTLESLSSMSSEQRAVEYHVPSWSWASYNRPVSMVNVGGAFDVSTGVTVRPRAKVDNVKVEYSTNDLFGRLRSSSIRISGLTKKVHLSIAFQKHGPSLEAYIMDPIDKRYLGGEFFDDLRIREFGDALANGEVHCLLLGSEKEPAYQAAERRAVEALDNEPVDVSVWNDMGRMVVLILVKLTRDGPKDLFQSRRVGVAVWGWGDNPKCPSPRFDWIYRSLEII